MPKEETLEQLGACWEGLEDPRLGNAALHDVQELPMIALCCVLCGGQGAVDMALFAEHWRLDVVMNEDRDRTRMGHGPHNLAVLRHIVLNAMQKEGSKGSLRGKFKRAGWDDDCLFRRLEMF